MIFSLARDKITCELKISKPMVFAGIMFSFIPGRRWRITFQTQIFKSNDIIFPKGIKLHKDPVTISDHIFRLSLIYLFSKDAAKLCKSSSQLTQKLASHSCHISFLKACRDHNLIPKGLRLTDPIKTQRSQQAASCVRSIFPPYHRTPQPL